MALGPGPQGHEHHVEETSAQTALLLPFRSGSGSRGVRTPQCVAAQSGATSLAST
jgi:hypothetical protein